MKLHHTQYSKNYRNYLLDCIYEDNEGNPLTSDQDKINHLFGRINSEYGWQVERFGKQKAIAEWLGGCAIMGLPIYYGEIIELAQQMGSASDILTEKEKDNIFNNYYSFMALQILRLEKETSNKLN